MSRKSRSKNAVPNLTASKGSKPGVVAPEYPVRLALVPTGEGSKEVKPIVVPTTEAEVTVIAPTKVRKTKAKPTVVALTINTSTHANGSAFSESRPGVVATIVRLLNGATKDKPVTKATILETLAKEFKDRDAVKMKATVMMQVPSGLKIEKRIVVASVPTTEGKGYYIDPVATAACQAEYAAKRAAAKTAQAGK